MKSVIPTSWKAWTTARFVCEVIKDRPTFIRWLIAQDLIPEKKYCDEGHEMERVEDQDKYTLGYFRCRLNHFDDNDQVVSWTKDTCFEDSYFHPEKVVMVFLQFANDLPLHIAMKEVSFFGQVTHQDILDWYCYCHEIVSEYLFAHCPTEGMLGGKDASVEIDVLRFGERRKFSRHITEGMYILGFIEHRSSNYRLELCPNNKHSAKVLLPLIQKHVHFGTTVMSDMWSDFNEIKSCKTFHFRRVNYEGSSCDETGTKVQEAAWRLYKRRLLYDGVDISIMADYFMKFLFQRKLAIDKTEPFEKLLKLISLSYLTVQQQTTKYIL